MARVILASKPDYIEVYADIPGLDLNGSTIPPDITLSRPDLVIINPTDPRNVKNIDIFYGDFSYLSI